jgi:hypothetical protein
MIDAETQNDLGKEIVAQLGKLSDYGAIIWWDSSGSQPLDGATSEWGIDVKTVNKYDPKHRYDPEERRGNYPRNTKDKNQATAEMGLKGILGILVVLDYRNDTAEIHAKEMPLQQHWDDGTIKEGAYSWPKYNAPRLLDNIKFQNPAKDFKSDYPHVSSV